MSDYAKKIIMELYKSYSEGEDFYSIKMPQGSEIHNFNMAIKELLDSDFITLQKKNLCVAEIVLTEKGLEFCMDIED